MKIGVFDSGLGGLFTTRALTSNLAEYDYVYLGDTKRLPYGSRSHAEITTFLEEGVSFLFSQDCALVIVACNTASAEALHALQTVWLPKHFSERRVLGMIIPLIEEAAKYEHVGLIATEATVHSGAYEREASKRAPHMHIQSVAAPLLVPLIENGERDSLLPVLKNYLKEFTGIDALILGCTHYPIIEKEFALLLPGVQLISQTSVVPEKTRSYLAQHPEIDGLLSKNNERSFFVTKLSEAFKQAVREWFGQDITITETNIEK